MINEKLGIIGGFGAYATLNFYKRILEVFKSDTERDYPHIIMDNNFTMPSRTRALLYGDDYQKVVCDIAKSMELLCQQNVGKIVLVCGTAHAFLEDVYKIVPIAKSKVINIIELTRKKLEDTNIKEVLVIAAEGTLKENIYGKEFEKGNIHSVTPSEDKYNMIREFIESVKKNNFNEMISEKFLIFIENYGVKDIVLGCTEFPVLIEFIMRLDDDKKRRLEKFCFWDPLEIVMDELKNMIK